MFIERDIRKAIEAANRFFPALLLTGARQVGKTTFLRRLAGPERKYATFDDAELRTLAKEDPKGFLDRFSPPVLLDEVQYVPGLLSYIKMVIDERRLSDPDNAKGLFWLTGSQQFELMQGVSDSLAGRIGIFDMGGISQAELAGHANIPFTPCIPLVERKRPGVMELFRRIWQGTYPEVLNATAEERNFFYSNYVSTYLERDIRNLKKVHDIVGIEEIAFLGGGIEHFGICSLPNSAEQFHNSWPFALNKRDTGRERDVCAPRKFGLRYAAHIEYPNTSCKGVGHALHQLELL